MGERKKKTGVSEGLLTGVGMVVGGAAAIWWAWNAPPPQSEPGRGEALVTVEVLNLADRRSSSSISSNKNHRVAYAFEANGLAICANGRFVNPDTDPSEVCTQEWTDIGRGTWEALDAEPYDAREIDVIYRTDNPTKNFPVETREGPARLTMVGLGLLAVGILVFVFSVRRLRKTH